MSKYITFGNWNSNYKYIFISIIFIALHYIIGGIGYDSNPHYYIDFFPIGEFSGNYLIHETYLYFVCIIVSFIFIFFEKYLNYKRKKEKGKINKALSEKSSHKGSIKLIYKKIEGKRISKFFILFIIFIIVLMEQFSIMFFRFFLHMYFWMVELYFIAFLYKKLFKMEIYKHQYLAFAINVISIILTFIKVFLTLAENDEKKALYVKYWWLIFIGPLIFLIHAFLVSYSVVQLKSIFYLKFIPVSQIILIYGILGFILCLLLSIIFTFNSCGNKIENNFEVKDYICGIINNDNQTFIENIEVYFSENWKKCENFEKRNEIIISIFKNIFFAIHKYFEMKILENLTPFHRIFSSSVFNCTEIIVLFLFKINIINGENKYFKSKIIIDIFADLICVISFFIYLEIIELTFCDLSKNLRKNIIIRGSINDSDILDLDKSSLLDDEDDKTRSDYNSSN